MRETTNVLMIHPSFTGMQQNFLLFAFTERQDIRRIEMKITGVKKYTLIYLQIK